MSECPIITPRKLIEVALPLDAINEACSREKSIRHGHPSTIHLWWARRPLAAARAVIFSQFVNDPAGVWECQNPGMRPNAQQRGSFTKRRLELFKTIEELILWENTTNESVLEKARAEIRRSWAEVCELNKNHPRAPEVFNPEKMPALHDPFAGGGAIPLEAQRLGLEAFASDLNPVAVVINKATVEIPPKFSGREPVNPEWQKAGAAHKIGRTWHGAAGIAEDVRYYGDWMRSEAWKRIGHLYPLVEITQGIVNTRPDLAQLLGQKLTVIAWIWARTVKSPDPSFSHVDVPLVSTFILSTKPDKQSYVQPIIDGYRYRFTVKTGTPPLDAKDGTKITRGANFRCLLSGAAIEAKHIHTEAQEKRMGARLMAIVAEGERGRIYLDPTEEMEALAASAAPTWKSDLAMPENPRWFSPPLYGLTTYGDLFTPRQLVALTTFSDLASEARKLVIADYLKAEEISAPTAEVTEEENLRGLDQGGAGAQAYADSISVYLACGISRSADFWSNICIWANQPKNELVTHLFGRQAIPMSWDFAEANPFSNSGGNFEKNLSYVAKGIDFLAGAAPGHAQQADAAANQISSGKVISTDPPYYDNIGYADLSDYFYVWLRRSLKPIFPNLFATLAVPKAEELVATPYRHGGKESAETFFLQGMTQAMKKLADNAHIAFPITIYYAFKQSDTEETDGTSSTGWVTFLEAVNRAGLQLSGTWPMRTERQGRMIGNGTNSLASSIVLVCRKRALDAPTISRREFIRELNSVLPGALDEMTKGSGDERSPVDPVDLSQAIIGPGMAVYSKYTAVLEADGSPMSVRTALQLINRFLAEDDFDADTQFCLSWFEQNGWKDGPYGDADTLARGKGTSVDGVKDAGAIQSGGGKVRLFKWSEYPADWDPLTDNRTPIWEALHHLIRALKRDGGEAASGALLAVLGGKTEAVRQLAYRLYTLCERLGQAEDARAYNELITSWTGIETAAAAAPKPTYGQLPGFENA
jgi:putative DNA methylase